jgi:predicted nucleotidyltransferase
MRSGAYDQAVSDSAVGEAAAQLAAYGKQRDALLERILVVLESDARVRAVWLTGSFGRGEADAWSDFDLHVAIDDREFLAFLDQRSDLYARIGRPLLVQQEMNSNATPGARFQLVIYPGPLEVDWNIGPLSMAVKPQTSLMLLERADIPRLQSTPLSTAERLAWLDRQVTFFWAMAPIAIKYIGRAQTRRAVGQIGLLSDALLSVLRLLADSDSPTPGISGANRALEPEFAGRLPRLAANIDPVVCLAVVRAHCAEVERLHPALRALGVPIPEDMPAQVANLAAMAEETLFAAQEPG